MIVCAALSRLKIEGWLGVQTPGEVIVLVVHELSEPCALDGLRRGVSEILPTVLLGITPTCVYAESGDWAHLLRQPNVVYHNGCNGHQEFANLVKEAQEGVEAAKAKRFVGG